MPASPSTARLINDRLALRLLQQEGSLTAGRLKQLTGLSRPTVADLLERLAASGLITVVGESGAQRRGPNARLYGIVADRAHLAALDVRTGGVLVLVSDLVGRVLAEVSVPIDGEAGTGAAVERAVGAVERAAREAIQGVGSDGSDSSGGAAAGSRTSTGEAGVDAEGWAAPAGTSAHGGGRVAFDGAAGSGGGSAWGRLHTVGIGAPGLVDPATGELRDSSGLPAWHRSLVAALQERLPGARVTVENETNLAAVAEQREGVARDRDTFVLLWLGHGVGAAVVLDGTLRRGASGGTGEIGFLPVPGTGGLPSATDCEGGFHALVGAAAIGALAARGGLPVPGIMDGPGAARVVAEAVAALAEPDAAAGRDASAGAGGAGSSPDAPAGVAGPAADGCRTPEAGSRTTADDSRTPEAGSRTTADDSRTPEAGSRTPAVDPRNAARFLDALADRVAIGAASVAALLDPGCVVLGGEVGQAGGAELAGRVAERLRRMSPLATEVRASELGGGAVLRGALLTARDRAQDELFTPPGHRDAL
ncbi:ROK family transcriptional regulator [Streptomyces sp. NPDC047024]|uniref:ROK family transcriptional regulator n=1 Tax=Streptomyces sp. NPDC047024 TaxID=3155476 RepID=UPI0033ED72EA